MPLKTFDDTVVATRS